MTRPIKALGEIALRVDNLDAMQAFYEDVVGLELMHRFVQAAFFRIAEGYGDHTQIVALFDRSGDSDYKGIRSAHTTVDHFAFAIDLADYETEKFRLEGLGLKVKTAEHSWVHWRSLYIDDPEGNMVEWVCYDEGVGEGLS
jgi:catechol 2,3-dioxygenase